MLTAFTDDLRYLPPTAQPPPFREHTLDLDGVRPANPIFPLDFRLPNSHDYCKMVNRLDPGNDPAAEPA